MNDKIRCTGCNACVQICPRRKIKMHNDEQGFQYPFSEEDVKCEACGLCRKVCAMNDNISCEQVKVYAAWASSSSVVLSSSSGGVFQLLARLVLLKGGVVFGAAFDDDFNITHKSVQTIDELAELIGSKYVQSDVGNTYKETRDFLNQRRLVLYSGVPCQLKGLQNYLGDKLSKSELLIRVDLFCMGSPSPGAWHEYVTYMQNRYKKFGILEEITFRHKTRDDWQEMHFRFRFRSKTKVFDANADPYFRAFLKCYTLRPSCYHCELKTASRNWSDMTLGDFWGIDKIMPDFVNINGTSIVMVHGERGGKVFDLIKEELRYRETTISPDMNGGLKCMEKPERYERFWDDYQTNGIRYAAYRNVYDIKFWIKHTVSKFLKCIRLFEVAKRTWQAFKGVRK